jgi:hypothetical protein
MKPTAYISPNGILYKDLPPDSVLELTPLFNLNDVVQVGKFAQFSDGIWREVTDDSVGQFLYTYPNESSK